MTGEKGDLGGGADGKHRHRVLLIEDDPPIRERLAGALTAHGDCIVAEAANLAEARTLLAQQPPDLIVADLGLPDGLAIDFLAEARERQPEIEILVISVLGDETTILAAIAAGASGYILKDALPEDIHSTALEVLSGGSPISPSIARFIVRRARGESVTDTPVPNPNAPSLTAREFDILWGIAKGLTYNEIADRLGLSRHTVPSHIKAIYRKLQVETRGEAVYEAIQYGLIKL
ncbi:response regulator [Sphingopyxis panaciterrulae]|uniref:DNA-binding NarL/FixJ family response regulator n=1 Tax=Sphingopyxis panaciterrulae TaxID=462372 RepID=A0A7W9B4N2_9SPHN|nr:response regulator transcription factor [Sphingopyxis panaciterrulae]MBB5705799.1 DNA-binding NarL/FixJ family response regulator [Sphingopyxis panaciterrulae]